MKLTSEFLIKRIKEQKDYMAEIRDSDRSGERKQELLRSAYEVLLSYQIKLTEVQGKTFRGFHWASRACYNSQIEHPEVNFGIYVDDGGTIGAMAMRWIPLGDKLSPRLECFDDSFEVLETFTDLIRELAKLNRTDFTDEQFVKILLSLGFKDLTKYHYDDDYLYSDGPSYD